MYDSLNSIVLDNFPKFYRHTHTHTPPFGGVFDAYCFINAKYRNSSLTGAHLSYVNKP